MPAFTTVAVTAAATASAWTAAAAFVVKIAISWAISRIVSAALSPKKKNLGADSSAVVEAQERLINIKQPVAPWQVIYGRCRVGGVITFVHTHENGLRLEMVITLAGHVVQEIGDIYFDDEVVPLDGNGDATGKYAGWVHIEKSLGDEAGQPFPNLVTNTNGLWSTSNHWQKGRAKIYVHLDANTTLFPGGVPTITAIVKGKKVFDPRGGSPTLTAWSANAALCILDYLTNSDYGLGASYANEIDATDIIAAANACDEDVTLVGSPTTTEDRYRANGAFTVDKTPQAVLGDLLAACAGRLVNVGGKWHLTVGAYDAPTLTFDEGDLAGPISVQSLVSRRDNCNAVKGVFVDPNSHWQPVDFPPITSATYLSEDQGERNWRDIDLSAFVTSGTQAQRLAKIELLRTRQALSFTAPFKLTAWQAMPGRTVAINNTKFGWSSKVFEVIESKFAVAQDGALGVQLSLRETAAAIYDWSTIEEQAVDVAPNTSLPDVADGLDIDENYLSSSSGTADLLLQGDGTVVPRVRLRWAALSNPFITHYEVQFTRLTGSPTEWVNAPNVTAPATEAFALPMVDGEVVDLRVRAVTAVGAVGAWAYERAHTVVGKTAVPSDVTGANAVQSAGVVVMGCDTVEDADLDLVEIRLQSEGNTSWDDGAPIGNILRGQTITSAAIPPGDWDLLFKAKDTSGNYSATAARVSLTVTSEGFTQIYQKAQAPDWLGEKVNLIRHWTGVLTLDTQGLASTLTDDQLWNQYAYNPYDDAYYVAPVIDKGINATARLYGDIVSNLGPGETSGLANPALEVDTRLSSGSFDGYLVWTVGTENFRYALMRIHVDTSIGKPVITEFTPTIDGASREERGTYTTDGSGSASVTFGTPFHSTPVGTVSPQGSGDVTASYTALGATGFTGHFKSGGAAAAGTASYSFTGA